MSRNAAVCLVAPTLLVGLYVESAAAGSFEIRSCQSDAGSSTRAFSAYATRGMQAKRACKPGGTGKRGLITRNHVQKKRIKRGSVALFELRAAPNTEFASYTWRGRMRRVDCRYTIEIYAVRPAAPGQPRYVRELEGNGAGQNCPKPGRAQVSKNEIGHVYDIRGTTRIVQRIICEGKKVCSARGSNYIRTRVSKATAVNNSPPQVGITGGDLVSGGWVNGNRGVDFQASDDVGVRSLRLLIGGAVLGEQGRPCDPSISVQCPSGPGRLDLKTTTAAEGTQQVVVQAVDAAGNFGNSQPAIARIDNTPPTALPVAVEGGEAWRNRNGFAAQWANPVEGDRAPISAAHFRLCRTGGPCENPQVQRGAAIARLSGVQVPSGGDWTLRMWREDAAGNARESDASPPVRLRYDPDAPALSFDGVAALDPTLVGVAVDDRLSGVSGGQIEISREGSGAWRSLPTALEGDKLRARIDDAQLPPGAYLLRARATDHAGNTAFTDRRADGSPAVVTLPLRAEAQLVAGFARRQTVRRVVRRGGKRRVVRRRGVALRPRVRARQGQLVTLAGTLHGPNAAALRGASVQVLVRPEGGGESPAGSAATDGAGRYRFSLRARTNATIRLAYAGTPLIRGATRELQLLVPARSSLRASRRRLLNGRRVVFSGRVIPRPALSAGKLVELQTLLSGRWQTFRTTRADATGRWRAAYRFRRTVGVQRYRFRARLPREAGYPLATGRTRAVTVTVRGR